MNRKTRVLVAVVLFVWTAASMYLVWYTKYEMIGIFGFLILAALNSHYKKQSKWSEL
jgi:hypothetical protein